jgi:L-ascorbate metabolism protein UlaG (beta-lactamase superfamily)
MSQVQKIDMKGLSITRISRQSWFKIQWSGQIIHFDPGYAGNFENQSIPLAELQDKADFILISHTHKDHLQPEAIEKILGESTMVFGPAGCRDKINHPVTVVKPGDKLELNGITIIAVEAYNTEEGRSTIKGHHKGDFVGYLVYLGSLCLYFAGDTDLIPEMAHFVGVDIAFLPIGGTYVMDPEEALQAVKVIRPKMVIPMHQASHDLLLFQQKVDQETHCRASVLEPGQKLFVSDST